MFDFQYISATSLSVIYPFILLFHLSSFPFIITIIISDTVKSLQQQMVGLQESLFGAQDCLKNQVIVVRNRLSTHHKLMSDIRNLLKSMVKVSKFPAVISVLL